MSVRRRVQRSEDGQALLLALGFILGVSLIVGALLFEAWGGFATTMAFGTVLQQQYQADAAVQEAINALTIAGNALPPIPPGKPLWVPCPVAFSSWDSNPVTTANGPALWTYCTILSDTFEVQNVEISACATPYSRIVIDGSVGAGPTTTISSATANFTAADVGMDIETTPNTSLNVFSIATGTYITTVTSSTTATISQPTTNTALASNLDWTITQNPTACPLPLVRLRHPEQGDVNQPVQRQHRGLVGALRKEHLTMSRVLPSRADPDREAGFTLPELLISLLIVSLIIGALGAGLITSLTIVRPTGKRLSGSNDTEVASTYFSTDAASTDVNRTVSLGVATLNSATITAVGANFTSGDIGALIAGTDLAAGTTISSVTNTFTAKLSQSATGSGTGLTWTITRITTSGTACADQANNPTTVIGFSWTDTSDQAGVSTSEVKQTGRLGDRAAAGAQTASLVRVFCEQGQTPIRQVMAQDVQSASGSCSATAPTTCSLTVTELGDPTASNPNYTFTLTGTPRVYGTAVSYNPIPPLLVLCRRNCITDPGDAAGYGSDTCQDTHCTLPTEESRSPLSWRRRAVLRTPPPTSVTPPSPST